MKQIVARAHAASGVLVGVPEELVSAKRRLEGEE